MSGGQQKKLDKLRVRRSDVCKILAIAERTLARLEEQGVIVPAIRGKGGRPSVYDLAVIVPAYIAHATNRPVDGGSVNAARAWRDTSQAQLNDLKRSERLKELLPRAQLVLEVQAIVKAARAKILALPRRLTQAGVPREYEPIGAAVVQEALEELSRLETLDDLIKGSEELVPEQTDPVLLDLVPQETPQE